MILKDLKNKKIAILWFWREGKSTLSFLQKVWCRDITVLDKNIVNPQNNSVNLIFWENYLDNLEIYDLIIKTPWISPFVNNLLKYREKLVTQTEIFFDNYQWKVIGITWTKGKSTTATLLYETLKNAWYKVKLVWNIWKPVLDEIDLFSWFIYDYIIYEMSSYMLDNFAPKLWAWILINLYSEHLDWHDGFENYKSAKLNIIKNAEFAFGNIDINDTEKKDNFFTFWKAWDYSYKNWSFFIGDSIVFKNSDCKLVWEHFMINTSSILGVIDTIWKIDWKNLINNLKDTLKSFSWLPHRLQDIWTYRWITFIDDAISTTPESTIEAIKTFWDKTETIFLWWTDRGYDFKNLVEIIQNSSIVNIVLFPDTGKNILKIFQNILGASVNEEKELNKEFQIKNYNFLFTNAMQEAVKFAYKYTSIWKICLLSTASPSYSNWKNYEEKWDEFKKYIEITK